MTEGTEHGTARTESIPGRLALRVAPIALFVAAVWIVSLVNLALGGVLNDLGIRPRRVDGLPGLLGAPFLHGGLIHLISNTLPLAVLGALVALRGAAVFWTVTVLVAMLGGLAVWLLGRTALHIGASGVVFGYFGYLVALGWFERKLASIGIAVLTLALYSGLIWGVLPLRATVSWEGHLFGLLAGVLAAYWHARAVKGSATNRS